MVSISDIQQLPKKEKLKIMEMIWAELSFPEDELESPSWHSDELKRTEERFAANEEVPVDWAAAKEQLRSDRG